jgi:hypothetical protein
VITGTPVRPEIMHLARPRTEAAASFGLDPTKTTILVTGGSQGARRLNELSAEAAGKLPPAPRCCTSPARWISSAFHGIANGRANHKVLGFCDQMPAACRGGSGHRAGRGLQPHRDRHLRAAVDPGALSLRGRRPPDAQRRGFRQRRAAELVQERDLDAEKLASMATSILRDLPTYKRMAKAARALAIPDAAERVCAAIEATLPIMNALSQRLTDTSTPLQIHLIGVAGSGMSGLALLLLGMGHKVSGSDRVTTAETERMQGLGLHFSSPHTAEAVKGADLVVFSSAIRPDNPAYAAAVAAKIPLYRRAECLAAILHTRKGIVISGTHGKTTTSSMTAHVLREAGSSRATTSARKSRSSAPTRSGRMTASSWSRKAMKAMARSRSTTPEHAVILNIEAEHLDFYRDLDHIREVFTTLADQTRGKLVYCAEDPVAHELCRRAKTPFPTAGRTPTTPPPTSAISRVPPHSPS